MVFYPVVGLIIGLCLVLVYHLLAAALPSTPADALLILFYFFLTGALHVDGLADSVDGLMGGWDRESRLEIMKDSRIGSLGAIAIMSDMGLRFLFIQNLPDFLPDVMLSEAKHLASFLPNVVGALLESSLASEVVLKKEIVLLIMPVVGRWAQVLSASISTYAREETGTASGLVAHTRPAHCLIASILPLLLIGVFYGPKGIIILAAVFATVLLLALYTKNRIGGVTGDTLGMTNEVSELVFLFLFFVI